MCESPHKIELHVTPWIASLVWHINLQTFFAEAIEHAFARLINVHTCLGWQNDQALSTMSEYFQCLQGPARVRYLEKLHLVGLEGSGDPYSEANSSKFTDDLTLWPAVEYGHIFGYFITRPGLYTQEHLLAWKQLDAYNYFQSGYVRKILVWSLGNIRLLKSLVNPSQRSPDSAHHCWLAAKRDGTIMSAHCTCMAG